MTQNQKTDTNLPSFNERVLVFDTENAKWVIMQLVKNNGSNFWKNEARMYYPIDFTRFPVWQPLPENPI